LKGEVLVERSDAVELREGHARALGEVPKLAFGKIAVGFLDLVQNRDHTPPARGISG